MIKTQKINLKKQARRTVYFPINQRKKIMIILVMPHLKMEVVDKAALEDLVDLVVLTFLTYLKIFLVTSEVEEDEVLEGEVLITEDQI